MIAYHGKTAEKRSVLKQLRAHKKADEIAKGFYWQNGKGCAVGCTIHGDDHAKYEPLFGIPQALARLEDTIFEGLPNVRAKEWPIQFMSAIKPGADLSRVQWRFLHWLLTDEKVNPGINHPLVKDAVAKVAEFVWGIAETGKIDVGAADSAYWAARSAARSADSAAYSAAYSAARSAAYSAVYSAADSAYWAADSAYSAAYSATDSAYSAYSAARSAAYSAYSAADSAYSAARSAAYSAARSAARSAAYVLMADKLLSLLKAA